MQGISVQGYNQTLKRDKRVKTPGGHDGAVVTGGLSSRSCCGVCERREKGLPGSSGQFSR